ncbi:MAG: PilZ domain-containing protein [Nitrospiraceae bacterium]
MDSRGHRSCFPMGPVGYPVLSKGWSETRRPEDLFGRSDPRLRILMPCLVSWQDQRVSGTVRNISHAGLAVMLPGISEVAQEGAMIQVPDGIMLRVRPVHIEQRAEMNLTGFQIETIEKGAEQWKRLCSVTQ